MSDEIGPIHLVEDEKTGDRFLVYGTDKGAQLDIRFEGETLWMTQAQIADLFGRDRSVVTKHIQNIFEEGELDEENNVQKMHTIRRPATIYSLDVIISVGYRVSSTQATMFRKWATSILVQYAKKGFVVDTIRLKDRENRDRIKELRDTIRDLRSEEAQLYQELQDICTLCQDYDPTSNDAHEFFRFTQAKFIYAVTSHTPSELIYDRADASGENMGLQTWPNVNIRKKDVVVSKNYLSQTELNELNRLTNILLDIFDDQAELGRLTTISQAKEMLEDRLRDLGRTVLKGGGNVKTKTAKDRAESEYAKYKQALKVAKRQQTEDSYQALAKQAKGLPKTRK
jgi:hypothetical protein